MRARVVPVALELIDRVTLAALEAHLGERLAPAGTGALLIVEVDGFESAVREEIAAVAAACQVDGRDGSQRRETRSSARRSGGCGASCRIR